MNRDEFFKELEKTKIDKLREIASKNGNLSMFDNNMDKHVENIEWLYGIKEDNNSKYSGWTVIFDETGEFIKVEVFKEFNNIDDSDSSLTAEEIEELDEIEEFFNGLNENAGYDSSFDGVEDDEDEHDNSGSNEISLSMKLINDKPVMLSQLGNPEEVLRLMVEFTRCITGVQPKMKKVYLRAFKELIEELNE